MIHRETKNGGPVHWIHENYRCPNCKDRDKDDPCCQNVPEGFECHPDSVDIEDDDDVSKTLTIHDT